MKLFRLRYRDDRTLAPLPNMEQRVEFFFHYWTFLFTKRHGTMDTLYMKSHRTIINKVRLQVDGNFEHAKSRIKKFMQDDKAFSGTDPVIQKISDKSVREAIYKINRFVKKRWSRKPYRMLKQLDKLQRWLDTSYASTVCDCCIELLSKDSELTKKDATRLMKLVNYFLIELFNKGYDKKFISEIPLNLYHPDWYSYERSRSSFASAEEFDQYKEQIWQALSLDMQIRSLMRVLNRPNNTRFLIYSIDNINFRSQPITLLGVEFYNPNFNPRITPPQGTLFFSETFTLGPNAAYQDTSRCNALVEVAGVDGDKIYGIGFERVTAALAMLNDSLDLHGKVSSLAVLNTNEHFNQLWGSSRAIVGSLKPVDTLTTDQAERVNFFNNLNQPSDEEVIGLLRVFYEEKKTPDAYNPDRIWMILEATFAHAKAETDLQEFFFNCYKLYLRYNLMPNWELFFIQSLNRSFSGTTPEDYYELSREQLAQLGWTGINIRGDAEGIQIARRTFQQMSQMFPSVTFLQQQVAHIECYFIDRPTFYANLKVWLDYHITEFYAQRNLRVHSNMSDELFLLKQQETMRMVEIVINVFLDEYLKSTPRKSISDTVNKIARLASRT